MCRLVKPPRVECGLMHCRLPGQDINTRTAAGANVAVDVRFGDGEWLGRLESGPAASDVPC